MFVPVWVLFMSTGLLMAFGILSWAVRHHQFDDQERARYLPLAGLTPMELADRPPVRRSPTLYGLLVIVLCGFFSVGAIILILLHTMPSQ